MGRSYGSRLELVSRMRAQNDATVTGDERLLRVRRGI
jgi:hypothetical protein